MKTKLTLFVTVLAVALFGVGCAFNEPEQKPSTLIRYDGLYATQLKGGSRRYLRFFKDGKVVSCVIAGKGFPGPRSGWEHPLMGRGTVTIKGNRVHFITFNRENPPLTILHRGQIINQPDKAGLDLNVHSFFNDRKYRDVYTFRAFDTPE